MTSLFVRAKSYYQGHGLIALLSAGWRHSLKRVIKNTPETIRWAPIQLRWLPYGCLIVRKDNHWKLVDIRQKRSFSFQTLDNHNRFSYAYQQFKKDRYTMDGFVEIEDGDIVVDIGAYIGDTTEYAAQKASFVLAIEPSPITTRFLRKNMKSYKNVEIENIAAWKENTVLDFKISDNPSEDSALDVDSGEVIDEITIEAKKLFDIAEDYGIDTIDYLKVEAEGAEPEVLLGADGLTIKKVAVNAGKERYGDDTVDAVTNILKERGYVIRMDPKEKKEIIYAKLDENST